MKSFSNFGTKRNQKKKKKVFSTILSFLKKITDQEEEKISTITENHYYKFILCHYHYL